MRIEFNDGNKDVSVLKYQNSNAYKKSKMATALVKFGIAKDLETAQKILIGMAVLFFVISAYIYAVYVFGFNLNSFISPKTVNYNDMTPAQKAKLPPGIQKILLQHEEDQSQ